jgi:hypothetical protein
MAAAVRSRGGGGGRRVAVELQDVGQVVGTLRVSYPEIVTFDVGGVITARTCGVAA